MEKQSRRSPNRRHSAHARPVTGVAARAAGLVNMRDTLSPRRGTLYPASRPPTGHRPKCLILGRGVPDALAASYRLLSRNVTGVNVYQRKAERPLRQRLLARDMGIP